MSEVVEGAKRIKFNPSANGNPDLSTDMRSISESTLRTLEDGLAMLRSSSEKLAQISLHNWTAVSEESNSYIALMMSIARSNAASAVTLANELVAAKGPSDIIAITNAHAKRQLDFIVAQNRHLWGSAQKLVTVALQEQKLN